MILLDGRKISEERLALLAQKIKGLKSTERPGLVVVRVGEDPASKIYVSKKVETCRKIGFMSREVSLPDTVTQDSLEDVVNKLNQDPQVHGILVQLPLPKPLSEARVIAIIDPRKDVDGFHLINRGALFAKQACLEPCTPKGVMTLLHAYKINVSGMNAVVIGRSLIVGRPMSLMLDAKDATVTLVHSKTQNMNEHLARADLIVSAVGRPHFLSKQKLKSGVILIDVGINRLASGKLVGDIDLAAYESIASYGTPVPGGIGPMTICTLLENTWQAFVGLSGGTT